MMKTALIFPGQGSQSVGMGRSIAERAPAARDVFEEADRTVGFSLSRLCFEGPEGELRLTANTQPAILATSVALLRAFEEKRAGSGFAPDFVAGHSLGEYTALVAAGGIKFADAIGAVRQRGIFMQEAVPEGVGAMAALVGCDVETVTEVCLDVKGLGVCSPANINSPKQVVIAGHAAAVGRAVEIARERGVRRAVMLPVSAPFHCELMKPAADRLQAVLDGLEFEDLRVPLVANVSADLVTSGELARACLIQQVASPVLWSESIQKLIEFGVTRFIEIGPGKVLTGLVRQISREVEILNIGDAESLEQSVAALG